MDSGSLGQPRPPESSHLSSAHHDPAESGSGGGTEPHDRRWAAELSDLPEAVVPPNGPDLSQHVQQHYHEQPIYLSPDDHKAGNSPGDSTTSDTDFPEHHRFPALCRRKRFIVPLAVFITLLAVGGVLGGVLGTMLITGSSQSTPGMDVGTRVSIHESSGLAFCTAGAAGSSMRVIIFQNTDGELVELEWQGSRRTARLVSNSSSDPKPQRPLAGSPLRLVRHGSDGDLHLFYFDDALRFAHAVRRTRADEASRWEPGSLSTSDGRSKVRDRPSESLRLSAALVTAESDYTTNEYVVIMYQADMGSDSVCLISSADPDDPATWNSQSFSLGADGLGMAMQPDSPGFLLLPVIRSIPDNNTDSHGVRMFWDIDSKIHKTTFGAVECSFSERQTLENCIKVPNSWEDVRGEELILDAPKPLSLSAVPTKADVPQDASDYIMQVLDGGGSLTELQGSSDEWTGHAKFAVMNSLPDDVEANFTNIAASDNGILYAVFQGRLLEFARAGDWWRDKNKTSGGAGWKFLSIVDTDLTNG